jgi:hypothetical protein
MGSIGVERKQHPLEEVTMFRSWHLFGIAALAASAVLLPEATLAFNPQPDPPGKRSLKQSKSLGGPDTKVQKGMGSWKSFHEVDEKSKWKGGSTSLPAVQKSKKP